MIIEVKYKTNTRNRNKPGRVIVLECDACHIRFERPYGPQRLSQDNHACSRKCHGILERCGGVLDLKKRKTSMNHYGVDHPRKAKSIEDQRKNTCLERYGVTSVLALPDVHRLGEEQANSCEARQKAKQTLMNHYGVEHALQSPELQKKYKATCLERYGVENPLQSKEIVNSVDWKAAWKKQHETKKRLGVYQTSKIENELFERLIKLFGDENIQRQVQIQHEQGSWAIDFKVYDTYVQLDGVYWHGLDRDIKEIRHSQSKRDNTIMKMIEHDRIQDLWFKEHRLKLIRITDHQAKLITDEELSEILM